MTTKTTRERLEELGARAQVQIVDPANDMERDLLEKGNATFYFDGFAGESLEYVVGLEPGTFARWLLRPESLMVLEPCNCPEHQ